MDDDDKNEDESGKYCEFGAIKDKLRSNGLRFVAAEAQELNKGQGGVLLSLFRAFREEQADKEYPGGRRFCAVIDRRKPEDGKNEKDIAASDELIMFEPPSDCSQIAADPDRHWLRFFETSRQCIVPQADYKRRRGNKSRNTITSLSDFGGAMMALSFHAESASNIRCYLYANGQHLRFFPADVVNILPNFFDSGFGDNAAWKESEEAQQLVAEMGGKLRDEQFEAFLTKYGSGSGSGGGKEEEQQEEEQQEEAKRRKTKTADEVMAEHSAEKEELDAFHNGLLAACLPLRQFGVEEVAKEARWRMLHDAAFRRDLEQMMRLFVEKRLSGEIIMSLPVDVVRDVLEKHLKQFGHGTLEMMMQQLQKRKAADPKGIGSASAAEMAYLIHGLPCDSLREAIEKDEIDGAKFIELHQGQRAWISSWIRKAAGMSEAEIYQIEAALFRHHTLEAQQIGKNLPDALAKRKDLEAVHHKVKNGADLKQFGDVVNELLRESNGNGNGDEIQQVRLRIAQSFGLEKVDAQQQAAKRKTRKTLAALRSALPKSTSWHCGYCGNFNHLRVAGKQLKGGNCNLCGVSFEESLLLRFRGYAAFLAENRIRMTAAADAAADGDAADIDELLKHVQRGWILDISCPASADADSDCACPCVLRVARFLVRYVRCSAITSWKNTKGAGDQYFGRLIRDALDSAQFRQMFVDAVNSDEAKSKKMSGAERDALLKLAEDSDEFFELVLRRKQFIALLKQKTGSNRMGKYASVIFKALSTAARTVAFASGFDTADIEADFAHIQKAHIANASDMIKTDTRKFFEKAVRFEGFYGEAATNSANEKHAKVRNILSALAQPPAAAAQIEEKQSEEEAQPDAQPNQTKFVSKSEHIQYGFGVWHRYAYLSPIYGHLREELLLNGVYSLSAGAVLRLLTKAIQKLREKAANMRCSHFDADFNILRNAPISAIHVLCVICYTDVSALCSAFRATFRLLKGETEVAQVEERHRELYHMARGLFEAVQFFGESMSDKDAVYHGLNVVMQFAEFVAYFDQPVSTTKNRDIGTLSASDSMPILSHLLHCPS